VENLLIFLSARTTNLCITAAERRVDVRRNGQATPTNELANVHKDHKG
jgi:hypothetical protein